MCFSIPKQIKTIEGKFGVTEDGKKVSIESVNNLKIGDYINVYGSVAVNKISQKEALKIRKLIQNLNS